MSSHAQRTDFQKTHFWGLPRTLSFLLVHIRGVVRGADAAETDTVAGHVVGEVLREGGGNL